ncbi:hypothetical protein [Bacillus sp. T3]|uniref:hypothetical protein n=1 Tax=Bacillus sp. T3 TaxID=467262 RepID=UPI00298112FC|nr:hypothetical protein [Bacillus sp. T3]
MIPKENLHYLVEQVSENDTQLVYKLLRSLVEKGDQEDLDVVADFLPLAEKEKTQLAQAKMNAEIDELIHWYEQHL